jgi:Zn-dependent peptidase ImmA (M78 family)
MSKKILKYDDNMMQQALEAVKRNHVSVKSAAKQFNVPRTTLYYTLFITKLKENIQKNDKWVQKRIFGRRKRKS